MNTLKRILKKVILGNVYISRQTRCKNSCNESLFEHKALYTFRTLESETCRALNRPTGLYQLRYSLKNVAPDDGLKSPKRVERLTEVPLIPITIQPQKRRS